MIVVHHLENSRSQRVLWILEELGLDYDIRRYQRDPETMLAPPALRAVHPLGKSPVVTMPGEDGTTITLAESGAILETLVERHGPDRLRPPPGSPQHLSYRYWMHYAEGSAMTPLLLKLVFDRIASARMPFFAKPIVRAVCGKVGSTLIEPQLRTHLDFLEQSLADRPWFAGSAFSAADVQLSFPIEAAAARAGLDASRPRLWDWLQRAHARPAYQRALERGGPYQLLS